MSVIVEADDDCTPVLFVPGTASERRRFAKEVIQALNVMEMSKELEELRKRQDRK